MLGHRNVATTQKYLGVNYGSVREALENMSVESKQHIDDLGSLKKVWDAALFLELEHRGYDLSALCDADEVTAEIVNIGYSYRKGDVR